MDGIFDCPFLPGNWGSLNLNILETAMFYGDTSWNFPNTRSPFNRIYFMMDGEAYLENEEERVELLPGNVYLVPAECRYSYVCPSTMQKFYIHFTMELLPGVDLFSHLGKVWGLPYEWDFLEDILGAVQKESVGGLLYLKAVFSRLVYDFFEQGAGGDGYLESFRGFYRQRSVLDYLEGHLSAGLRIQELADAMGAKLGCTRPIVEAGWLDPWHQVGQTGVAVAPRVLLSLGVSGAIQHVAGTAGAQTVIAVNDDPDAPVFSSAHYRVVGDCMEVVSELLARLRS